MVAQYPEHEVQQSDRPSLVQTRLAILEQENAALRSRLQSCEQSQAVPQPSSSPSASEQRLLEATATAANALLTIAPFDQAVNTALQIIGEALDTDRITVIENFAHPSGSSFSYWRVVHEWDSPGIMAQFSDPDAAQGSYEEIQWLYGLFQQSQTTSYLIEEAPEPFRSEQAAIGVKATHLVSIHVEGKWWGVLGLDDCREVKHRTLAELSVLKIAADCIGSAIERDRTQQALLQAEQARSADLAKVNEALRRSLDKLANGRNLKSFLEHILQEALKMLDGAIAQFFIYDPKFSTLMPSIAVDVDGEVLPAPGLMNNLPISKPFPSNVTRAWERMVNQRSPIFFDLDRDAADYWPGMIEWHRRMGHYGSVCSALMMGDQPLGMLGLALRGRTEFTASEFEFFRLFRPSYAVLNGNTHGNKPLSLKLSKLLKP